MDMPGKNALLIEAVNLVPRVLGLMNRQPDSLTYGCSDRNYWHYLLHDIPNARLQDAGWLLNLVYLSNYPESRYHGIKKLPEWALASVIFWTRIQHKNGAFDEVYPFEYSYCATAFSTWWAAEAFLGIKKIDKDLSASEKLLTTDICEKIISALEKAANWLIKKNNLAVSNQEAAAAVALVTVNEITKKKRYLTAGIAKLGHIISNQHSSGYYPEYGGEDIGYHSLSLTCLSTLRNYIEFNALLDNSLITALQFLESRVDKDGLYEWWLTSRRTQYLYPFGLASCWNEGGCEVLKRYINGLSNNCVIRPSWIDDRYCTFMAIDYLRTYDLITSKGLELC